MSGVPETVHVENMDHFVRILFEWHQRKVKELEHVLAIPEGVEVHFNTQDPIILQGDMHKGFIMGLSLGLMELGTLPFAAEPDDEDTPPTHEHAH